MRVFGCFQRNEGQGKVAQERGTLPSRGGLYGLSSKRGREARLTLQVMAMVSLGLSIYALNSWAYIGHEEVVGSAVAIVLSGGLLWKTF